MEIVTLCNTTTICNLIASKSLRARNVENVGRIQNSTEKPADEIGRCHWLHEGVLATVLLGIGQAA